MTGSATRDGVAQATAAPDAGPPPLVTFALFAYNQEHYIGAAIEGAFAQTYQPLEIILSDDCSHDRTFAIMQEMAAAYDGPHRVIARQSSQNRGTLGHVIDVARAASGRYMIVAAGDDVSYPHRTTVLAELFAREQSDFCWSAYDVVDETGGDDRHFREDYSREGQVFGWPVKRMFGASAAYRTFHIKQFADIQRPVLYEDNFLELYATINDLKVSFCPQALIRYRLAGGNLSFTSFRGAANLEAKLAAHLQRAADASLLALAQFCPPEQLATRSDLAGFQARAEFYLTASGWQEMGVAARMALLRRAPDRGCFTWLLPRAVLGRNLFLMLKGLQLRIR